MSDSARVGAVATLESVDKIGRGLRVEFFRHQDRYAHRISAVGCEQLPVLLLESIEGTATEIWPASPALQALNVEDLTNEGSQPCAMLVGMAGGSHWSLSVQTTEAEPASMMFDAACRVKAIPDWLGSSYSWVGRVQAESAERGARLDFGSGSCFIEPTDAESQALPYLLDRYQQKFMFSAPGEPSQLQGVLPTTLRWRLRFILAEA